MSKTMSWAITPPKTSSRLANGSGVFTSRWVPPSACGPSAGTSYLPRQMDRRAFPSGHAASAFAAAAVLERHLGYRASWPALAAATYVATSRLVDNRHFLSDVMFGASVGTVAGWTVVGRHGRNSYALLPYPVRGGAMVALVRDQSFPPVPPAAGNCCVHAHSDDGRRRCGVVRRLSRISPSEQSESLWSCSLV